MEEARYFMINPCNDGSVILRQLNDYVVAKRIDRNLIKVTFSGWDNEGIIDRMLYRKQLEEIKVQAVVG